MDISTEGLQQLIVSVTEAIASIDIKAFDFTFFESLLDYIAPVWNPIWAAVNAFLEANFGF